MKPVILAVSLFLPFTFSVASAQLTKVTVGYSAISEPQFPAWMAKESGIFRKIEFIVAKGERRQSRGFHD